MKILSFILSLAVGSLLYSMEREQSPDFNVEELLFMETDSPKLFESFDELLFPKRSYDAAFGNDYEIQEKKAKPEDKLSQLLEELKELEDHHKELRLSVAKTAQNLAGLCGWDSSLIPCLSYAAFPFYEGAQKLAQDLYLKSKKAPYLVALKPESCKELLGQIQACQEVHIREIMALEWLCSLIAAQVLREKIDYPDPQDELIDIIRLDDLFKESEIQCAKKQDKQRTFPVVKLQWLLAIHALAISKKFAYQLGENSHSPLGELFQKTIKKSLTNHARHSKNTLSYKDFCVLLDFIKQNHQLVEPFILCVQEFLKSLNESYLKLGLIRSTILDILRESINDKGVEEVFTCAICQEALKLASKNELSSIVTPCCDCQYYYHNDCLETSFAKLGKQCPSCRKNTEKQFIIEPKLAQSGAS